MTDAYVLLAHLDPALRLGGVIELKHPAAATAVESLGQELGLGPRDCAGGIVRVAEAQVATALRVVSVERGRDPRGYALLAFGGAGPLHQGPLARELGCPAVIVPRNPGVLAALGLLAAPPAVDAVSTDVRNLRSVPGGDLEAGWRALEREARRALADQGVDATGVRRSADCRYRGQAYELEVDGRPSPADLAEEFGRAHRDRYGYVHEGEPVEVVNLRVRAEGPPPALSIGAVPPGPGPAGAHRGTRAAVVDGEDVECALYDRDLLGPGDRLSGPAFVASADSTCLLLGGQRAEVDGFGNLVIREG